MFTVLLLGLAFIVGLVGASFGAYKDTLWEDFSILKFFRTPVVILMVAVVLLIFPGKGAFANFESWNYIVLYILVAIGSERLLTDVYKTIRRKQPSKFRRGQRRTRKT